MVPGDGAQLLIFVVFLLPGTVFQTVQTRLLGPSPEEQEFSRRVVRALGYSTGFALAYVLIFGGALFDGLDRLGQVANGDARVSRLDALLATLGIFVLPAALAALDGRRRMDNRLVVRTTYDPTPHAWDFAFNRRASRYVRVQLSDGSWLGGYFGLKSFATGWPFPRELYLERAWDMSSMGAFRSERPRVQGQFIDCADVRRVECSWRRWPTVGQDNIWRVTMSLSRLKRILRLPPERSYGWIAPRSGGYSGLEAKNARPEIPSGPVPPPPTADEEGLHEDADCLHAEAESPPARSG